MDKRRKIAVFSANVYDPMVYKMQMGINASAVENGVKVIYFVSFSDMFTSQMYDRYIKYDEGDIVSSLLPDLDDFDGIIRIDSSYGKYIRDKIDEILQNTKVPVINVGGMVDKYFNILNDETRSFSEVVEHIIEKHGCRDIYHLAGIKGKYFTDERIQAYKSMLIKHDIPFDEEKIYYGTLWRDCGAAALDYFLDQCAKRGKKYPDAIVCANDYMAIAVANECSVRGIQVPGDIIVTGYDGIDAAVQGFPSITTSEQPFYNAGYESINIFKRMWEGETFNDHIRIMGTLHCNQSCGCKPMTTDLIEDVRSKYLAKMGKVSYLAQSTSNLILSAANCTTQEDVFDQIGKNARSDTGFNEMLLCLAPGWNRNRVIGDDYPKIDEEMSVVTGFIGDKDVEPFTFRKKDILPQEMLADPKPHYIFSIHHLQYYMGYLIVSPDIEPYDQLAIKSWIVNLGAILENVRIRHELGVAIERLENLYNRDMLTGLYNRHGYEMFFERFFDECKSDGKNIAVLVIDMDDLKYVNDNYGHAEGDYSLCTIAEAMTVAAQNGEICLRTGGDEFVVVARDYDMDDVAAYSAKVREHMALRTKRDAKEYSLGVSIGAFIGHPSEDGRGPVELSEEYMKLADEAMYEEKKTHKKK